MSVIVKTNDPAGLLQSIRSSIDQGHIRTWTYDQDGDFSYAADRQWTGEGWMRPSLEPDFLVFGFVPRKDKAATRATYAVLHGRLIETLLTHFSSDFEQVHATCR